MNSDSAPGPLSPYRVLDLTEGGAMLAGRIFAELGADVIKVEPPGGSPSRDRGPFFGDEPDRTRSLFWYSLNLGKKSVSLDIARPRGREIFLRLLRSTDVILESFRPGYLDSLGLGYPSLAKLNPGLVMASITPFGQSGPYASFKGPDIVPWAMGGILWMTGDPDRPPVRLGVPEQALYHAAASAVGAVLLSIRHRRATGKGQHVDESAQQHCVWLLFGVPFFYQQGGVISRRGGGRGQWGSTLLRTVFPCKDGHISFIMAGGVVVHSVKSLVDWMASEAMASAWLRSIDWPAYDPRFARQDEADALGDEVIRFFLTKTKQELLDQALKRGIFLAPVSTVKDLAESRHLAARNFWMEVDHPELGRSLRYPGPALTFTQMPRRASTRPPLVAEHNTEVYSGELALSAQEMRGLHDEGVI